MSTVGRQAKRTIVVSLALASMALGGSAEVLARGDVHARVTIKIKRKVDKDTIKGRVVAKDQACERRRKVRLVVSKPNRTKRRVGTPKTNRRGKWKFTPARTSGGPGYGGESTRFADPGDYVARVGEKKVGGVTCAAAKSDRAYFG